MAHMSHNRSGKCLEFWLHFFDLRTVILSTSFDDLGLSAPLSSLAFVPYRKVSCGGATDLRWHLLSQVND